jgi:hypothetical protein
MLIMSLRVNFPPVPNVGFQSGATVKNEFGSFA